MRKAFLQQKAKEDVREIALYIADDNLKAAEGFRLALERARVTLVGLPEIGRAYDFGNRELKRLRVLSVPDFFVDPGRGDRSFHRPTRASVAVDMGTER